MASADNDFIGSYHAANLSADDVNVITEDGAVNITTFSFDSGGDGSSGVDPIPDDNNGSSANANLVVKVHLIAKMLGLVMQMRLMVLMRPSSNRLGMSLMSI